MLLNKCSLWRTLVKPKTQSCTTALHATTHLLPLLLLELVHGWWKPCPARPLTPSLRIPSCLPAARFSFLLWSSSVPRAGKEEAANFGTQCSPSVILKRMQSQRSERDSKKKTFCKAPERSIPLPIAPSASSQPVPPRGSHRHRQQLQGESDTNHPSPLITTPLLL